MQGSQFLDRQIFNISPGIFIILKVTSKIFWIKIYNLKFHLNKNKYLTRSAIPKKTLFKPIFSNFECATLYQHLERKQKFWGLPPFSRFRHHFSTSFIKYSTIFPDVL